MNIKTDSNGCHYYETLPEGWRIGYVDDFFDRSGKFIINKPYLVQSFHSNKFEAYRSRTKDLVKKLKPWMDEGRVFVMKV